MKKFALALTALAAFTGSAVAADLSAAPAYSKAPAVVATPSWTGFYIFGGARRRHLGCEYRRQRDRRRSLRSLHEQQAGWRRLVRHGRCGL